MKAYRHRAFSLTLVFVSFSDQKGKHPVNDVRASVDFNSHKFMTEAPSDLSPLRLYSGAWHYDFDKLDREGILSIIRRDSRPNQCRELFAEFDRFHILELGPADGYNTAALELLGASTVTAVEGNVDAFLRCLLLKNAFGLRAKFLLGDFTQYFRPGFEKVDLLYASGVLYHLKDPVGFLEIAGQNVEHIYIWTHYYDESSIQNEPTERLGFSNGETSVRRFKGRQYTYHRKYYDTKFVSATGYIGGLGEYCHWLSRDELLSVIESSGFSNILRVSEDRLPNGMPAINVFASRS
jgi:hypothetical protein